MNTQKYSIELPESAFSALKMSPDEFIQEMKYAAVVMWYDMGMISQGKAAEIAGLDRFSFMKLLSRYKVSIIQCTPEMLKEELRHTRNE
ncbi:MAG: UPF0175 family protein [Anaerolineales bacterium]|nr:UPF0175 family protein [Anaerolineales bacterium]